MSAKAFSFLKQEISEKFQEKKLTFSKRTRDMSAKNVSFLNGSPRVINNTFSLDL